MSRSGNSKSKSETSTRFVLITPPSRAPPMTFVEILTWSQVAVLCPLAVLGLHRGWMVMLYVRHRRSAPHHPEPAGELPRVTVQLPIYNERYVASRLIEAVAALDYPRDRLELQVLDDSTDDTREIVEESLRHLPPDLCAVHVRRAERTSYKAGALAHGLEQSDAELVAVFDADFIPPPDFLKASVPLFAEPKVGMVQCRWDHVNPNYSLLTRMQALLLDGHFAIEHLARSRTNCFFNFNGTAGIFRRSCIDDAGGWQGDTLTEDLDLSYRAQLRGWRFVYLPEVTCPAELPVRMNAFLNQQHRWAKGSIQTARKLLGQIWRAPVAWRVRIESTFHLLGNLAFPLLLCAILLALPLQMARLVTGAEVPMWLALLEGVPLLAGTLGVLLYYGSSQLRLERSAPGTWWRIPLVLAIGAGLCVNNTMAVLSGLGRRTGEFRRTPKHRVQTAEDRIDDSKYRAQRGRSPIAELTLGGWAASTSVLSAWLSLPLTAVFHGFFAAGLLWIGFRSLAEEQEAATRAAAA